MPASLVSIDMLVHKLVQKRKKNILRVSSLGLGVAGIISCLQDYSRPIRNLLVVVIQLGTLGLDLVNISGQSLDIFLVKK